MEDFIKYTKIRILGYEENKDIFTEPEDEIVIEEKIDGANFRFYVTQDNKIIFGSHTQQLTSDNGEDTNIQKNFMRCVDFIRNKFKNYVDFSPFYNKIFYGECMLKHTINYDWEKIPPFLGFDIYDLKENKYLNFNKMNILYESLDLPIVPLIKICKAKDIKEVTDKDVPISEYISLSSKDRQAEGIVFKNYKKQIFAKYVRDKFKEENRKVFGEGKKFAKNDDEYFLAVYCTNARIDKCIFKLVDEGKVLDMTLMSDLLKLVYKDIWEENWQEISMSKKKVDLENLKKLVSRRCLEVLKQSMVNNSLKL